MATDLAALWGHRIRKIRRERELTATDVAAEVGISRAYLHHIESGRYTPSDDKRVKLAAALGVEPGEIFTYDTREVSS